MRQLSGHAIAVRSLNRDFGSQHVLSDVDLTVAAGEVRGLLGPPGAGKSTLLRVLAGQIGATEGDIKVLGRRPGTPALRGRVAFVEAGDDSAHPRISGLENLAFYCRVHQMSHGEAVTRAEAALIEVGLGGAADGMVGEWTPEMRRRLTYARALLTEPDVLLLDAPARTDEPGAAAAVRAIAIGCARRGAAVLWAVERLDELAGAARTVTLLAYGRVRYSGTVSALADRSTRGWAAARAA